MLLWSETHRRIKKQNQNSFNLCAILNKILEVRFYGSTSTTTPNSVGHSVVRMCHTLDHSVPLIPDISMVNPTLSSVLALFMLLARLQAARFMSMSRQSQLTANLQLIQSQIREAAQECGRDPIEINLVAVSKTKPAEDIEILYEAGHRHFGENYMQELTEKAELLPKDIIWHFIGHLQSNKATKIINEVPNLGILETVDSLKLARKLNSALESIPKDLDIYIQIDTSNEDTKSGITAEELPELIQAIRNDCKRLRIRGVMTIGAPNDLSCFDKLVACRSINTSCSFLWFHSTIGMLPPISWRSIQVLWRCRWG